MPTNKPEPEDDVKETLREALKKIAELSKKQEEAEARLTSKEKELDEIKKELTEATQSQEGWLVTVPNAMYDGVTLGVKFSSGMVFLPKDGKYDQARPPVARQKGMSDEQFEAYKKMVAALNTAEVLAYKLRDDFGYEIQFYNYERLKELKDFYRQRAIERARAEEQAAAAKEAMKDLLPARMGLFK